MTIGLYMQETHPPRRPGAPHARALLPRGDRRAAGPGVLYRAAAGDIPTSASRGSRRSSVARPPGAALHAARGDHEDDHSGLPAAQIVHWCGRRPTERPALPRGRGARGQWRRNGACHCARLLGVRRGRCGARRHDRRRSPGSPRHPCMAGVVDMVLGCRATSRSDSCGPVPRVWFGTSPRAFGAPGAGGSFGFADPDARLGYAYVMNKLDFYLEDDPREKALRDAVYRAITRLGGVSR